jgi:predicted HTH transcriptional regulator
MNEVKKVSNIHLLIIDDDPENLAEERKWLNRFGYEHIASAQSAKETQQKLEQGHYDIIVADMRMEADDSGFLVVEEVKKRNLSSVVIILTANDTVADCRQAFKMGAWDYISKNLLGNVFKALDDSIQEAITYFNRRGNTKDEEWIAENIDDLRQKYLDQFIAVINQSVIEVAETEAKLKKRLQEQKLPLFLTVIKKIGEQRPIADLITLGESQTLEFKSTLQWDVRQNRKNKHLQLSVLKTIVAFLNSAGGRLIIGVEDDGTIFGLERDLSVLSKQSLDQFEQTIMHLISDRIGASFTPLIRVRFEKMANKDVCAIEVKKATRPAFLRGNKGKEFYIRVGNASRSLDIEETLNYIQMQTL